VVATTPASRKIFGEVATRVVRNRRSTQGLLRDSPFPKDYATLEGQCVNALAIGS
jgi:hypothetical protein